MLSEKAEKLKRFSIEKNLNFEELISNPELEIEVSLSIYLSLTIDKLTLISENKVSAKSLLKDRIAYLLDLVPEKYRKVIKTHNIPERIEMKLTIHDLLLLLDAGLVYSVFIKQKKKQSKKSQDDNNHVKIYSFYSDVYEYYEHAEYCSVRKIIHFVKAINIEEAYEMFFVNEFLRTPIVGLDIGKGDYWVRYLKLTKVGLAYSLVTEDHPEYFKLLNEVEEEQQILIPDWLKEDVSLYKTWFPDIPLVGQNKYTYRQRCKNESITIKSLYLEFIGFYCYHREQYFEKFSWMED